MKKAVIIQIPRFSDKWVGFYPILNVNFLLQIKIS
jgi:hypothetical protein